MKFQSEPLSCTTFLTFLPVTLIVWSLEIILTCNIASTLNLFNFRVIVLRNGISYDAIVTSLENTTQKYTEVEGLNAAFEEVIKNPRSVLLASSIEASYLSVTVSSMLLNIIQ